MIVTGVLCNRQFSNTIIVTGSNNTDKSICFEGATFIIIINSTKRKTTISINCRQKLGCAFFSSPRTYFFLLHVSHVSPPTPFIPPHASLDISSL